VAPEPFRSRFDAEPPGRELPPGSLVYCSLLAKQDAMDLHQYASIQDTVDAYDGGIAFVDHELGKLFELLKEEGLWEGALIVITSDHGELFMENGLMIGHGLSLDNEETLVPLLIKLPGSAHAGRRVAHVVESVDIMPTVLAALDLPAPHEIQGQDLIAGLTEGRWKKDHAFGISPNTGNNHYLYRGGVKFIEAVEDHWGHRMRSHLRPMILQTMLPPPIREFQDGRDMAEWKNLFYHDIRLDPLGLTEVFHRGDRIYDLQTAKFEWQTQEIQDAERLLKFKAAARALAARSSELGDSYAEGAGAVEAPSDDDTALLEALGYVGIAEPAAPPAAGAASEREGFPLEVHTRAPPTDRALLDRGDHHLWQIIRYLKLSAESTLPQRFQKDIDTARGFFEEFEKEHPDRKMWVYWRLNSLDLAQKSLRKE
jgi:hypothetical protein